ncbi:MAG: hypothetical protein HOL71_02325 [Euryarchaeota archaeon]|jgi:hypothetical protein|nr:hypothetical protein [Euryarchaeota archaeon]
MDSIDSDRLEESLAVQKTQERISQMNSEQDSKIERNQEKGTSFFQIIANFFDVLENIMDVVDFFMFIIKIITFPILIYLLRNEIIYAIKLGASFFS